MNKIFKTHRAIYNKLVEISREDCDKLFKSTSTKQFNFLKQEIVKKYRPVSQKHSLTKYLHKSHLRIPEEVMDSTFRDFIKALVSAREIYNTLISKNKKVSHPRLKFKSWKDNSSSIEIRARTLQSSKDGLLRMFSRYFKFGKEEGISFSGTMPKIDYSIRLQRTRDQRYYICIPNVKEFQQTNSTRVCAIDPGVRDFITLYDPQGLVMGITDGHNKIFKRCMTIDRLQSRLTIEKSKRSRYRIRRTIYNIYQRMKSMISDMHQKCSKWISENYNQVLLPTFETSDMTSKQKRISSKTSRQMLTWSHYKFRQMLKYKMERTGGSMIDCKEYYTSKTCSCCGLINNSLKGSKMFECSKCNFVNDRDVNASRNIYMMNEHLISWTNRVQVSGKPTQRLSDSLESLVLSF